MDINILRSEYRDKIVSLASKHGAENVRVFGSVARGDADELSDIDFIVDMQTGRSLMDFARLKLDLEDLLHINVDLVESKAIKPSLKELIDKDVIQL
jgi:uncharacterized protein